MEIQVFYITSIYFLLGAIGIIFINRKAGDSAARWKKFFVYALVVYGTENAIYSERPFPYLCAAVLLAGANELIFVWRWHPQRKLITLFSGLLIFGSIGWSFFYFSVESGSLLQIFIYLVVLTFDGFSQITGQLIGRLRFAGKISPNKTVEGSIGGLLMAMLTGFLLRDHFLLTLPALLLLILMICTAALLGDLLASFYKRIHNVKDYSNLIPGHGGVLDRFDSFIFTGAVWWTVNYLGWI